MEPAVMDAREPEPSVDRRLSPFAQVMLCSLTVVGIAAGMVLVDATPRISAMEPVQRASLVPQPARPLLGGPLIALGDNLIIGYSCQPLTVAPAAAVSAADPSGLAISFEVMNAGPRSILVTELSPAAGAIGLGGLSRQRVTSGGDCQHPAGSSPTGTIQSGKDLLFTFWYRRPVSCTRSWQARIPVQVQQMVGTTTKAAHRDIGTVVFNNNCPHRT